MRTHQKLTGTKIAVVLAVTALAVAVLGATPAGHAAARLIVPKASVGQPQLKRNAVTSLKVKDGTLLATDFKVGQLPAGPPGPAGISGYQVVHGIGSDYVAPGQTGADTAKCPPGKKAIGGGVNTGQYLAITVSMPTATGWVVNGKNVGSTNTVIVAYAVCAVVS
jgi:hypothetical protein